MTEPQPSTARTGWEAEPSDPDIADAPARQAPPDVRRHEQATLLAAIAAGGVIGSAARYGAGLAWPTSTGSFPWTTLVINVVGCALMGVLMVVVTEAYSTHRLVRPFLGTGVLGGFTTFSTYTVDIQKLITGAAPQTAMLYLAATAVAAIAAVWVGATATRALLLREGAR
jgi:CrcB protein